MSAPPPVKPPSAAAPPLRKPPGYRDPSLPTQYRPPPPAPPRKPINLPPSFYERKRRRSCRRTFCCCMCAAVAILAILLAAAAGLFYLWYQPRLPEIRLKSINFTRFNVSTTLDGSVLDSLASIVIEIKNTNQNLRMEYGETRISVKAIGGDVDLGRQTVAGFVQAKNRVTSLKFSIKVVREVLDGESAVELRNGFKSKNLVVDAEMGTRIGVKGDSWGTCNVRVKVSCNGVRLRELRGGGGGGAMRKCSIRVLNWIPIN